MLSRQSLSAAVFHCGAARIPSEQTDKIGKVRKAAFIAAKGRAFSFLHQLHRAVDFERVQVSQVRNADVLPEEAAESEEAEEAEDEQEG